MAEVAAFVAVKAEAVALFLDTVADADAVVAVPTNAVTLVTSAILGPAIASPVEALNAKVFPFLSAREGNSILAVVSDACNVRDRPNPSFKSPVIAIILSNSVFN